MSGSGDGQDLSVSGRHGECAHWNVLGATEFWECKVFDASQASWLRATDSLGIAGELAQCDRPLASANYRRPHCDRLLIDDRKWLKAGSVTLRLCESANESAIVWEMVG